MSKELLQILLAKYKEGKLTLPEKQQLAELLHSVDNRARLGTIIDEDIELSGGRGDAETMELIYRQIMQVKEEMENEARVVPLYKRPFLRWAVAASIILILGVGSYFLFFNKPKEEIAKVESQQQRFKNDVAPGKNKAVLTLADGSKIILDSAAIGKLIQQGNTVVLNQNGQLVYDVQGKANEILYNTLSTSRGETYATVLADGSKVWLNSASSIKFPVAFVGGERNVEITGEAYFEVAKDATKPFTVSVNGMNVQVLGTHFNINAYNDESTIKTTLLEGSVKVIKAGKAVTITPGQQVNLKTNGELSIVNNVEIEEVMAWKNGRFYFDGTDIKTVMRQLARWYDVDVEFNGEVKETFYVKMDRNTKVSNVFKILETTGGVHFEIDGKKVTVSP